MRRKANSSDVFDCLNSLNYKTVPEIRKELKEKDLRTGGFYMHAGVYITLHEWMEEGIVEGRHRSVEDHIKIGGYIFVSNETGKHRVTSLPLPEGKPFCLTEYRRIGSLKKNLKKRNAQEAGGLESGLVPA